MVKAQTTIIVIVLILVVLVGGFFYFSSSSDSGTAIEKEDADGVGDEGEGVVVVEETEDEEVEEVVEETVEEVEGEMKTFVFAAKNYKYTMDLKVNPEIKVKLGDKVRIDLRVNAGLHDWTVDELGAATKRVSTGESTFIEFTADKKGTFSYYCSVGSHRSLGMEGTIIVE